ncbi:MAG: UV DNA damage repair endonuclease UvsE [Phycisphaerales bacterium]|nr:UV DNA damage repair endonuclease UvsE [Phycisphaerales bacterium]
MNQPRLGLCCAFQREPIQFRTTTAAATLRRTRADHLRRFAEFAQQNAAALRTALEFCAANGIGCFRVVSQILPLRTHPAVGYAVADLPDAASIIAAFRECGRVARELNVRLTFHPDQFTVLNSPDPRIVRNSIAELEYQAEVAEWIGADVLTVHGGGAYGDRIAALDRLRSTIRSLPSAVRSRIALENDDRVFSPADLLPLCEAEDIPFVYDVHHHRCLPDGLSVTETTRRALSAWSREPLFHLSSPAGGWRAVDPRVHADFINPRDFPRAWRDLAITVEIEARAKETAVLRLKQALSGAKDPHRAPVGTLDPEETAPPRRRQVSRRPILQRCR